MNYPASDLPVDIQREIVQRVWRETLELDSTLLDGAKVRGERETKVCDGLTQLFGPVVIEFIDELLT